MPISPLPEIFDDLRAGQMVILVDDPDRENEGDLVMAAEFVTEEKVAFMLRHTSGIVCATMPRERADLLKLPLQVASDGNSSRFGTQFTVSVEAKEGITTGVSAADRATTIRLLSEPSATADDFARPGHVYPIRAADEGVLRRSGQTEGSVDLCKLSGLRPIGMISELMKPNGTMMRMPDIEVFAEEHGIRICTVRDVIEWRRRKERLITHQASAKLPTDVGNFDIHVYSSTADPEPHLALTMGITTPTGDTGNDPIEEAILVRAHSECLTGDLFHSRRCDCGEQLRAAQAQIAAVGRGVILYMRQEGRGIGLVNKIRAYALQDEGMDTVEANVELGFKADHRDYGVGAQILHDLGVRNMRLLTNNPVKFRALRGYGLEIVDRVALEVVPNDENRAYLRTKAEKLGHVFSFSTSEKKPAAE